MNDREAAAPAHLRPWHGPAERLAAGVAGLLMLGLSAVAMCYVVRQPGLDPIVIWPFFFWSLSTVGLGLLLWPLLRARLSGLVVGYALLLSLLIPEEPGFLARTLVRPGHEPSHAQRRRGRLVRVVTLNCGGGRVEAIRDALAQDPDILLLQESPGEEALDRIAPKDWEHAGWMDPAILVRGRLVARRLDKHRAHYVYFGTAYPDALGGVALGVVSTRLLQPVLRIELWRPEVWQRAREVEELRRKDIASLLEFGRHEAGDGPLIIGGDFNSPARHSLFVPFEQAGLTDSFAAAGRGWPNTITADFPFARIDQIWISHHFRPVYGRVVYTPHSDHRMVVVDLALR